MSIELKPHNLETYKKVTDKMQETNKVAVIHPTGTGKMFIALKLLEENNEKNAVYVAPSNAILHDVKKNIFAEGMTMEDFPKLKRITYQKLMTLSDEEIGKLSADIIILDEFHHCGAPEWGKGVERLINSNANANILGLSATPLRYFDGLRDMADELFENNVVSEMSLEEAMERGILPEATYVSTLYGYDKQLEDMQLNIDKIKDKERKEQAQNLFNGLKEKLDENTQNLPELFSKHMQNQNGKYIVFCRNIEDMNEKIEQAQKMFGKVNPNITVRAVSSKIKEADKILTEFEQDTDDNTLKLLYAVDMLNEGYHVNGLDGVVMMRPTFSPTIYTQQLGRALTVGGDKKPVVLDLVNNFDSCKIIEDFVEKMKEYKGNEGKEKTKEAKISKISIFDKTKEFREIAKKIEELSQRKKISLEEKIQIFEKFSLTGDELVGNTIFEGYPIGAWAIQIRSALNRENSEKIIINPTEEQLDRLENLGILERQFDSTIDEKINALVEWNAKYPKARMSPSVPSEILKEYSKTDEEYQQILAEYEKMQKYYEYVRARKLQNKLEKEQIEKCKEGNIRGVFGYPKRIEELAKKYGKTEMQTEYIISNYGTMENFGSLYMSGKLENEFDIDIAKLIIKDTIDVDANNNLGYDKLIKEIVANSKSIYNDGLIVYSSELLKEALSELTEREKKIIERRYDLTREGLPNDLESVGKEFNVISERIRQIEKKAIIKLDHSVRKKGVTFNLDELENDGFITDSEKEELSKIKENLQNICIGKENVDEKSCFAYLKSIKENLQYRKEVEPEETLTEEQINETQQSEKAKTIRNLIKGALSTDNKNLATQESFNEAEDVMSREINKGENTQENEKGEE